MSCLASEATEYAGCSAPSLAQIDTLLQPATTCALVIRKPSRETKNPVPLLTRPAPSLCAGGPATEGSPTARQSTPQTRAAAQSAAPARCRNALQTTGNEQLERVRRRATRHPNPCSAGPRPY